MMSHSVPAGYTHGYVQSSISLVPANFLGIDIVTGTGAGTGTEASPPAASVITLALTPD